MVSQMDCLVSEDLKEDRVLLAYPVFQVNLGSLVYQVRRVKRVLLDEMVKLGWMVSLDLRDQRATEETKERGVNQVEMEPDSQDHLVHLDHQDK